MKKLRFWLATIAVLLCSVSVSAVDFEVDGIYYNITSETNLTVEVTNRGSNNKYGGEVVIPENVNHNGSIYSVTSIGDEAFMSCIALRSVTIPNSVTSIGKNAFSHCSNLTSITIGNSVTSIGDWAFYDCYRLTSITIPNSVTSIGEYAFNSCSNLTNITIPNSVTSIGDCAFMSCSNVTSITIGNSITSIGNFVFSGCSDLTSITIPNSVTSIGSYAFEDCYNLTSITIPNSMTNIGRCAFYNCYNLTSITIPNSVTYIEDEAFLGCEALKSVINFSDLIIGKGSTSHGYVGYYANEVINVDGQIGDYLFRKYNSGNYYLCKYLGIDTILVLPNDYKGMNYKIDSRVFKGYSNLISITIPNSVTSIGDETFEGCSGLTSITIPNSVTFIGYDAFEGCSSLTAVHITDLDAWYKISFDGFRSNPLGQANHLYLNGEEIKDLVIPNSVTSIGNYAFWGCYGLTSVTIPNSVTSIGDEAFWGCYGLTSVTISNSVTSIGNYAFSYCYGLTSITVDKNNTIYDSRENSNAIINTGSNSLVIGCKSTVIPNSVTSIGDDAFYGCSDLTSITIPNSVTSIGEYAFSGCTGLKLVINFSDLNIEKGSTSHGNVARYASKVINADEQIGDFFFKTIDGNHYLLGYIGNDTDLTLPQDYKGEKYIIGDDAFRECTDLTSITIPNSVTSIEDWAFYKCSGLTSVTIPNSVTSIGDYAFYGCSGLTSVTIGNSVTSIGDYAFYSCSGLTSVTIGNSVTSIGDDAFYNCRNLKTVINFSDLELSTGSKSHGYVGYYADKIINADEQVGDFFFKTINSVHHLNGYLGNGGNLELPQDYKGEKYSIGNEAFWKCTDLTSITIPNSVTSIGSSAFRGCKGLTSITIPNSVTGIGRYAFCACTGLTNITIGNSVQNIEYGAFYNCTGLTSITIPNSVISIGSYKEGNNTTSAFSGCNQLTKLIIEDGYMYIDLGYSQFIDCPLEYVYIGRNHSYTNNPFKEGNTLKTAIIGSKVNKIGNYLFCNCIGLTSVTIPSSVTVIGKYTFDGCSSLTDITIPNSVMSIEYYAFNNCSALKDLYIGNSVTSLPNGLLSGCTALEKLYIGTSVTSIADNLLADCRNLNTLTVGAKIPPTVNDLGLGSQQYFTVKLQVPEGSKAMYQFSDAWKKFFNIEEFDPATGIAEVTTDAEDNNLPIYNLQGTRMTEDKENLPTGIYIQGGKKIFIK